MNTFDEYNSFVKGMKRYPETAAGVYPIMGLFGETTEVIEKVVADQLDTMDKAFGVLPIPKLTRAAEIFKQIIPLGKEMEQIKKSIRDHGLLDDKGKGHGEFSIRVTLNEKETNEVKKELGDALWYITSTSDDLGFTLQDVIDANIEKLTSRKERGVLHGSGDNR